MSKKFAVCFSGYPRFVRKQFDSIKKNILDGLGEYDTYAYFQWKDDWQNEQIHHEYTDKFEVNELEEFKELYEPLNLKKIEVIFLYPSSTLVLACLTFTIVMLYCLLFQENNWPHTFYTIWTTRYRFGYYFF